VTLKGFSLPTPQEGAKIALEYCPMGSVESAIRERPEWWNSTVKACAIIGIVCGMRYVHGEGVVHRDLKPSNILFDESLRVRICDFGISRMTGSDTLTSGVGTLFYMAPELFDDECTDKVDVYSFGVMLCEIVVGEWAWPRTITLAQMTKRVNILGERPSTEAIKVQFIERLVRRCWAQNPSDRPSFGDIFEDISKNGFQLLPDAEAAVVQAHAARCR
jgi:serine/threonine protein kinase